MPFTPYHFGPSGFIGLVFRKWLDIPVFVLANVIVDIEVLIIWQLGLGFPLHRYCHTFLIGAAVGAIWGFAAYPLRSLFKWLMRLLHVPYQTSLPKMIISGVLGVWLHVIIDGLYHWDIRPFWPSSAKPLYRLLTKPQVRLICAGFFIPLLILYVLTVLISLKNRKVEVELNEKAER